MNSPGFLKDVIFTKPLAEDSYLCGIPAVRHLMKTGKLSLPNAVTFFVGENGTGKSTLLEAIAISAGFNPEGGTRNFSFSTSNSYSELYRHITLARTAYAKDGFFLRAESFYNAASYIDEVGAERSYGGVSLHNRSHGESFLALVQNRFRGGGLYLLDEPEAALSPMRLLTLMAEIDRLVKENSQFVIATHSPMLTALPNAEVLEFSPRGIQSVDYRDTEHFQITKCFLEDPDRMLRYLLTDGQPHAARLSGQKIPED